MDRTTIERYASELDSHSQKAGDTEYWYARDIMPYLGYQQWKNFIKVVDKARLACRNSDVPVEAHFRDTSREVPLAKGAIRSIADVKLTRYACYLIAQNGDPKKEEVALLQSYFAVQTRKTEIIEQRMGEISRLAGREALATAEKKLSQNLYERGVDDAGFARIRSKGDTALFGTTTRAMKEKLGQKPNKPLADVLHPVNVAAKQLATEMTNLGVETKDLHGESPITEEHIGNNSRVRGMLIESSIIPEELPAAEDIKKVQRRARTDERRIERRGFADNNS
ncbi:DNA damage-inducible protein D [Bifidobacterium cebidarum]|uniref:Damage-inducible protein D n=1 Tax=Bifidobacterium cebidarum TaxID=2650773 RepID=A0A6I1G7Q7_9BIFI|nr:DNA damage-inducible protein D [Bifidobacterium cebidarum]KAB7786787.1 damage-inducible protein D [Bifidobacterium cebidarum]